MEMTLRELHTELRFNKMLLQSYRSLEACRIPKHYTNVLMCWVRRLESEFPLTSGRQQSVDTLKQILSAGLTLSICRIQDGTNIIRKAFNEVRPKV